MLVDNICKGNLLHADSLSLAKNNLSNSVLYLPTFHSVRLARGLFLQSLKGKQRLPKIICLGENTEQENIGDIPLNHSFQHYDVVRQANTVQQDQPIYATMPVVQQRLLLLQEFMVVKNQLIAAIEKQLSSQDDNKTVSDVLPKMMLSKDITVAVSMVDEFIRFFNQVEIDDIQKDYLTNILADLLNEVQAEPQKQVAIYLISQIYIRWQSICQQQKIQSLMARRMQSIRSQIKRLEDLPANIVVIAAGSTASTPQVRDLLLAVAKRQNGVVVLPGLDTDCNEDVEPAHAQYYLQVFLRNCGCLLSEVKQLQSFRPKQKWQALRNYVIHNVLKSAKNLDWKEVVEKNDSEQRKLMLQGINLLETDDEHEEVAALTLLLQKKLAQPGKITALVTADRAIIDKVKCRLLSNGIRVTDYFSTSLSHHVVVRLFLLISDCFLPQFSANHFFTLLKSPLIEVAINPPEYVIFLENLLRQHSGNYNQLSDIISIVKAEQILSAQLEQSPEQDDSIINLVCKWLENLATLFQPFINAAKPVGQINFVMLLEKHRELFKKLSPAILQTHKLDIVDEVITSMLVYGKNLPPLSSEHYKWFIAGFFRDNYQPEEQQEQQEQQKSAARLLVSSFWEMRLIHADCVIIAGMLEGSFPSHYRQNFSLGRDITQKIGFRDASYRLGQSAHDFSQLCGAKELWLSHAKKSNGTNTIASCFFRRMKAFLQTIAPQNPQLYQDKAHNLLNEIRQQKQQQTVPPLAPQPKPPLAARPKKLNYNDVQNLMDNPYRFYAEKILRLKPLGKLQKKPLNYEYNKTLYYIINKVAKQTELNPTDDIQQILHHVKKEQIAQIELNMPKIDAAIWIKHIEMMLDKYGKIEKKLQNDIIKQYNRKSGYIDVKIADHCFTLTAIADRIVEKPQGYHLLSYKTGQLPSLRAFDNLRHLQLAFLALIAQRGNFVKLRKQPVAKLSYLRIHSKHLQQKDYATDSENIQNIAEQLYQNLLGMLNEYYKKNTAFLFLQNDAKIKFDRYQNYSHLARIQQHHY